MYHCPPEGEHLCIMRCCVALLGDKDLLVYLLLHDAMHNDEVRV